MKCRRGNIAEDTREIISAGFGAETPGNLLLDPCAADRPLSGIVGIGNAPVPRKSHDEQFAVVAETYSPTNAELETMLRVFRNAQDDATTENPNEVNYLFGMMGTGKNIIWGTEATGSRKVILRKVSGTYESLSGAAFNVYRGNATEAYVLKHEDNTTETLSSDRLVSQSSGVFWIGILPYGTYYLEETTAPTQVNGEANSSYSGNVDKWFWLIVDESGVFMSGQQNNRSEAESGAAEKNAALKAA